MQHTPVTIEDQLISKAVREECPWENLPKRLQSILGSKEEWHRRVIEHCIKKRLLWNTCFACKVCKEGEYYEDMMRYLRKNLALFPYHLAEHVCRVMRISPFRYYCDMIFEVMRNEQPYDSIPNFSAADAFRLTGIGRNEFIDIMNKCRSKKIMWKLNKSIAKDFLPTQPVDFPIDPWWGVCLVNFTIEEFKKLSEDETATIDKICKEEVNAYVLFDPEVIKGLYQRGLIYFDVPVYQDDRFKVSKLEGFISNREQSYEDPIEELLYAVFVVSNENSTVAELASTLQADLAQLQAAASFVCRLGWAVKLIDPASVLHDKIMPGSPRAILSDEDDTRASYMSADGEAAQNGDNLGTESSGLRSSHVRVAFIVDANITSYLMMGSVSPGLKSHAVTLYEAGKLGHTSIPDLCKDLSTLEGAKFEGELQEFANHAFSLRCVLECLISGGVATDTAVDTMGPGTSINDEAVTLLADVNSPDNSGDSLTSQNSEASMVSDTPHEDPISTERVPESSEHEAAATTLADDTTALTETLSSNLSLENDGKPITVEGPDTSKGNKKRKRYRVDILRCESLASLTPVTLDRLFSRDYDIVVSMVPLPLTTVLPGPSGPVHFGPPSHSSMTQWMKLVLYSTVGTGPLSVILMKGQCLRMLPAPLAGCEKALIWSWDGSSVGGLGNKFEGNLVKGSILLHCLNCLLKCSAVLVQPLSKHDLDSSGRIVTLDIPLPLKNSDGSIPHFADELGLPLEENTKLNSLLTKLANNMELWTVGYIRLLKLFKAKDPAGYFSPDDDEKYEWVPLTVEFGLPLFSPKLCNHICKRIVSSELLQADSLMEQHNAMQCIRKRLKDICAQYQATGPAAKLLYQKEQAKEAPRSKLMNYASGKWNPLVDPSSPISGASSEFQRLKLANRQRCRTEVLSFDGSILRSYTCPVYEAATRTIDENAPSTATKADADEADSREVVLPGLNLLYDGSELHPFDIGACLQARQPVALIAEAAAASAILAPK
ncbi:hypothetical protein BRARA_K00992 [Brassica rapa]|uniref:Protein FAM91A1 n=3 Tax=Brassica TaxID=3705 RepID=A0ABQ8CNP5_BRANA|nr:protein FAM91A1 isoform X1 [Brassica napus]KAH0917916.1 hypothetical protein HID58_025576 [Brassica napus]RIA04743.1 hypothetical protein BRARA_K00992 [Brassica rapa]CAG7901610.1 unnamed protein product [Brassica rapa]VDC97116.1 unnamed protein product [Brassica rapa]